MKKSYDAFEEQPWLVGGADYHLQNWRRFIQKVYSRAPKSARSILLLSRHEVNDVNECWN